MKREWKKEMYYYSSSTTKECYSIYIYIQKEWSIKKTTYKESPETYLGVFKYIFSTSFSGLSLEVGESLRNSVIPPLLVVYFKPWTNLKQHGYGSFGVGSSGSQARNGPGALCYDMEYMKQK